MKIIQKSGFTIFLLATIEQRTDLVQMILANEIRCKEVIKQKDNYGNSALHLAMYCTDKRLIEMLLNYGINPQEKNNVNIFIYKFIS